MALQDQGFSEPSYALDLTGKRPAFWREDLSPLLTDEIRTFLREYSGIPNSEQDAHVHSIRDKAWHIRAYPCTGLGAFLFPQLLTNPSYQTIIARLRTGATLLDIGTFIGTFPRRLVHDGAPSSNIVGVDIAHFEDLGHEMYRDRGTWEGKYILADAFTEESGELERYKGVVDVVVCSQMLHQWGWEGQVKAAVGLVRFTREGSLVVGNQIGNVEAGSVPNAATGVEAWRHDGDSMRRMWVEVGEKTGTEWEVDVALKTWEELGWDATDKKWLEDGISVVEFCAKRLK